MQIIFVLGAPGSGKGTLCKILSAEHNFHHLSVGDYLRDITNRIEPLPDCGTFLAQIKSDVRQHRLIPAAEIVPIVKHKIEEVQRQGHRAVLVDGFPRDLKSAEMFDAMKKKKPDMVLLFDCPKDIARERFVQRNRDGDGADVFEKRYGEFERNSEMVVGRYREVLEMVDTGEAMEVSKGKLLSAMGLMESDLNFKSD